MSNPAPSGAAEPGGALSIDDRLRPRELAFWLLPVAGYVLLPEYLVLQSQVLIAGLFALSLDLVLGYAGIVSLGHAAFFGVGAYVAGLLSLGGYTEPISGLFIAGLAAMLVGFGSSFLVVGGNALTRLMVTLAVGLSLHEAANQASSITGGSDGLSGLSTGALLGVWKLDLYGKVAFVYSALVCLACVLLVRRVIHSPFGLSLRGIRENERRMHALGAPVRRRLMEVYTFAAGIAGVAGALSAQTTEFVGLEVLSFERSAGALVMLVLGGVGRLYGAFVGSLFFMLLQTWLSDINPGYWQFWLGLCLVLVAFFAHAGLLGPLDTLLGRLRWAPGADRRRA